MPPLGPPNRAEYQQALARIARRAALADYDRELIRNSQEAIRRSRALLEATKHLVGTAPPPDLATG
jgi:hypothetical protein